MPANLSWRSVSERMTAIPAMAYAICSMAAVGIANGQGPPQGNPPISAAAFATPPLAMMLPEAKPIYDQAMVNLGAANKGLAQLMLAQSKNKLAGLTPALFTQTHAAIMALRWQSPWLVDLGEPSGVELERRSKVMHVKFKQLAAIYRAGPKGQAFNNKAVTKYASNGKARDVAYKKAAKLLADGKPAESEAFMLATLKGWVAKDLGLLDSIVPYSKPFEPARLQVQQLMQTKRNRMGAEGFVKLRNAALGNAGQAKATAQQWAASLQQSPTVDVNGTAFNGQQLFSQISRMWKVSHWQIAKAEGAEMARAGLMQSKATRELGMLRDMHAKLNTAMTASLAAIVKADTPRVTEDMLNDYMAAATNLRASAQPGVLAAVDNALTAMSAQLHGPGVADLDAALKELLRWRAKAADARAARAMANAYPGVDKAVIAAATSNAQLSGLLPARTAATDKNARFYGCWPEIVTLVGAGAKVTMSSVASSAPTEKVRITALHRRAFATLPAGWDVQKPLAILAQDLMVTEQHPALSLEPIAALRTADMGAFRRVGGTIRGIYGRSLLEMKHSLPATSWNMFPLGPLPQEVHDQYTPQAVVHVDLVPDWFQHEYFVAPAAPPAPASSAALAAPTSRR